MFSISPKPKFFILNALRALSLISLLFVLIANFIMFAEDIKAIHAPVSKDHEECDYIENSSVPNQPAGEFRAFFSITLNILQILVFMLAELDFPKFLFEKYITCLGNDSLLAIGILEVLLAAQMMSHFLESFPLVACFFLLVAGILNICTMFMDMPRSSRAWGVWKEFKGGMKPTSRFTSHYSESEKGFGRNGSQQSHESQVRYPESTHTRDTILSRAPTYSPSANPRLFSADRKSQI